MRKITAIFRKYKTRNIILIIFLLSLFAIGIILYNDYKNAYLISIKYLGLTAKKENDCLKAIKYYSMASQINPKDYGSYFSLGQCYEALGRPDLALPEYEMAYSLIKDRDELEILFDKKLLIDKIKAISALSPQNQ